MHYFWKRLHESLLQRILKVIWDRLIWLFLCVKTRSLVEIAHATLIISFRYFIFNKIYVYILIQISYFKTNIPNNLTFFACLQAPFFFIFFLNVSYRHIVVDCALQVTTINSLCGLPTSCGLEFRRQQFKKSTNSIVENHILSRKQKLHDIPLERKIFLFHVGIFIVYFCTPIKLFHVVVFMWAYSLHDIRLERKIRQKRKC